MSYRCQCIALLSLLVSTAVEAQPVNVITNQILDHEWLEVGFVDIDDREWTTIKSRNDNWEENVTVFISLPDIGGSLHTEGLPIVSRLRNIEYVSSENVWQFDVKLVQANDSYCSKEWYVPQYLSNKVQISWLIVEKGVYNLSSNFFIVSSGDVTRNNSEPIATPGNKNAVRLWYPTGCDGDFENSCTHPGSNLAAIVQLQSNVNKVDGGFDMFLYVRIRIIFVRHIQVVLIPHSSSDPSIFRIMTPEDTAFMVFDTPLSIICIERMVFETATFQPVTSTKIEVDYQNVYDYPPGLYGAISTVSLTDATTLRQFNNTVNRGRFITQEDQCVDEQTVHTAEETAYTITVGESREAVNNYTCLVRFNSAVDTSAPTLHPTVSPTTSPTASPTASPTSSPTANPTHSPTAAPTRSPTASPTVVQTSAPTGSCTAAELEVKFTKSGAARRR
eukprot:CAMPEP_0185024300 /NCGR_PEP_ID=MMETSP1103-20130426/7313_1 /TAXON_ID=36769 /ORGANISM="Paraphysomonas bandaiensis, Strain Caron Lab Isolate" /LENGTH=446 /DNA_ID=CAMNT_0027557225 /DNA_START=100 /DNA_END=1440 /DNA_ORIENTATION=-